MIIILLEYYIKKQHGKHCLGVKVWYTETTTNFIIIVLKQWRETNFKDKIFVVKDCLNVAR